MRTQAGVCSECGKRMLKAAVFCSQCGTAAVAEQQVTVPSGPPPVAKPSSGWYPDPLDTTKSRYWDGEVWTNREPLHDLGPRPIPIAPISVVVGGLLMAIGSFLDWVKITAPFIGTVTKAGTEGDGMLTLAAGVVVAILGIAVLNRRPHKAIPVALALLSLGGLAVVIVDAQDIAHRFADINDSTTSGISVATSYGPGLWVVALGAVTAAVGTIMLVAADKNRITGAAAAWARPARETTRL
jgi:hypothetical protein